MFWNGTCTEPVQNKNKNKKLTKLATSCVVRFWAGSVLELGNFALPGTVSLNETNPNVQLMSRCRERISHGFMIKSMKSKRA
jgi:hypothetical protein